MNNVTRKKVKVGKPGRRGLLARVKSKLNLDGRVKVDFYYRWNSIGDHGVISQIFCNTDYDLSKFPLSKKLAQHRDAVRAAGKQLLIVDAGANIGASAVYFSITYPDSQIVAIEPEKNNVELLTMNCRDRNVAVQAAAISAAPGTLYLSDPGISDWGFRTGAEGQYAVEAVTVGQILKTHGPDRYAPFICKIDIEGAEKDLFGANYDWMTQFAVIIIELHDWMLPGEGNSRNFLKALSEHNFDMVFKGENAFCFNNDVLKAYGS